MKYHPISQKVKCPGFFEFLVLGLMGCLCGCSPEIETKAFVWKELEVTATAYNSVRWQTSENPSVAAWGDTLKPGMKVVAVSRDLLSLGIEHNTMVRIEGIPDTFLVKDKMHRRWKNKIDLYMGQNIDSARGWGRQKVCMYYRVKRDTLEPDYQKSGPLK